MGGFQSADCNRATYDSTRWWQSDRRCTAKSNYKLKKSSGNSFSTGMASENCNIQHAGSNCWGVISSNDASIVNCIDDWYVAKFPGQSTTETNTLACTQGCSDRCGMTTNSAPQLSSSFTTSGELGASGLGAALILGFGALAHRKRTRNGKRPDENLELSGANIA